MKDIMNQYVTFRSGNDGKQIGNGSKNRKGYITFIQPPPPFNVPKVIFSETKLTEKEIDDVLDSMAKENAKAMFEAITGDTSSTAKAECIGGLTVFGKV